ncbi:MAG: AIR synthase-related protein, partial [Planctomycetaceae bacterium]
NGWRILHESLEAFKAGRCPEDVLQTAVEGMSQLNVIGRDIAHARGAHACTDITGFGLAGHAAELAHASRVTVVLEMNRLPVLPGAEDLARRGNHTRASASNRSFADPFTRIEPSTDELRLDVAFDAQTSGGLLIALPADAAEPAVAAARERGATFAAIVGSVTERQDQALILRN